MEPARGSAPECDRLLVHLRHSPPINVTISRRLNAERLVLFGWSRAILLQLAHPLVAAGVAEHSAFRQGPLVAAQRLHHTVRAMLSLTFGTPAQRDEALARINAIHRTVHGVLREAVGLFAAGTVYSAEDADLLVWVHVTLLESIPLVYEHLVGPLSDVERDQYCLEAEPIVRALGVRDVDVPCSWRAVQRYMAEQYASGTIAVGADARTIARAVLAPPFAGLVAPAAYVNRLVTIGLLPHAMRRQYGFEWTEANERALGRWSGVLRGLRRSLPDALALWPEERR